jgi:uncharacterized membrane protein
MREVILAVSYWLHLVATVIWIGGITFILFIAIPTAKQVLGAEAGKLMGGISKRFTPFWWNYSVLKSCVDNPSTGNVTLLIRLH